MTDMIRSGAQSTWTAEAVKRIPSQLGWELPIITSSDIDRPAAQDDVWDMWPLMRRDGATASIDGRQWWFFLSSPRLADPDLRHDVARIRLCSRSTPGWRDEGIVFPDGFAPGLREWSGSAVLDGDGAAITLFFTAAGRREKAERYAQRLFATRAAVRQSALAFQLGAWSPPVEVVKADGGAYVITDQDALVAGRHDGFRDPAWFGDPADGGEYLLFTGSAAWSTLPEKGIIGMAKKAGGEWKLACPPVSALGVNQELERPHIVFSSGKYYLFWSTQRRRCSQNCQCGVNGLYGMAADSIMGPWKPLNGSGLVTGNPKAEPYQAYCWLVTSELEVVSFVDLWGLCGRDASVHPELRRAQFGGGMAPSFRLVLRGDTAFPVF